MRVAYNQAGEVAWGDWFRSLPDLHTWEQWGSSEHLQEEMWNDQLCIFKGFPWLFFRKWAENGRSGFCEISLQATSVAQVRHDGSQTRLVAAQIQKGILQGGRCNCHCCQCKCYSVLSMVGFSKWNLKPVCPLVYKDVFIEVKWAEWRSFLLSVVHKCLCGGINSVGRNKIHII